MPEHVLIVSPQTKRDLESWLDIKPEIVIPTQDVVEEIAQHKVCPFDGCDCASELCLDYCAAMET